MNRWEFIKLILRMGGSVVRRRIRPTVYRGDADAICRQVIRDCYDSDRRYFRTSISTYKEMWARDFGRSASALIQCGFTAEVRHTYRFALNAYRRHKRFALAVLPDGGLYNFPFGTYSPDGFAFFLYGLCALKDWALLDEYADLLRAFTDEFVQTVICPNSGLVRSHIHFSEARDYVKRSSSCYSNCMCFIVQQALERLKMKNPLKGIDYPQLLVSRYYNRDNRCFYDDDSRRAYISGDAAILPFWCGAMSGQSSADISWKQTFDLLEKQGFNTPCPSRYGVGTAGPPGIALHWLNPWQKDAIWTCLGMHFLETTAMYLPERFTSIRDRLAVRISDWGGFPEVLNPTTLKPFKSLVYTGETGMLWAANLLALLQDSKSFRHEHLCRTTN